METGQPGWNVFDPATAESLFLFRTPLADEFLALAAVEPNIRQHSQSAARSELMRID
jgi:hypothetical protein